MFIAAAKRTPVNLEEWAVQMMEKHNRKSHLAPQLSPSTQALLRGESQASPKDSTPSAPSTASKTPTSGVIPIAEDDIRPPLTSEPAPQRVYSNDVNSTGMYQNQSAPFDRQGFPPRTSSTFPGPSSGRSRDGETFSPTGGLSSHPRDSGNHNTTTTLPIRPAPPPSGPLPPPPGSGLKSSITKRPVANGSPYAYGENQQY